MQILSLFVCVFVTFSSCRHARAVAVGRLAKQAQANVAEATLEDIPDVVDMTKTAEDAHSEIEKMHERMAQLEVLNADAPAADLALAAEKAPATEDSLAASVSSMPADEIPSVDGTAATVAVVASKDEEVAAAVSNGKDSDAFEAKLEAEAKDPVDTSKGDASNSDEKHSNVQSAAAIENGFEATENAITLLHKQYAQERRTVSRLKSELSQASGWDKKLERRLRGEIKDAKAKEYEEKKLLAERTKKVLAEMEAEKAHEHSVEDLFAQANKTLAEKDTMLQEVEADLKSTKASQKKLSAQALRALKKERNKTRVLEGAVQKSNAEKSALKSRLERSLGDLSVARTEWRAEEVRLLESKHKQDTERDMLEANLTKAKDEVFALQAAKKADDGEFAMYKEKIKKALREVKAKLKAAHNREATLKKLREKDHVERAHADEELQKSIAAWKKKADDEQADAKKLQKELSVRTNGQHAEVGKLNQQLSVEANETERLQKERAHIQQELQGNVSRAAKLEEEVAQLRLKLKNGDEAKRQAEAAAKKAEEETAAAQAVAKQLSGTVPQLLAQAQHAKEAKAAEDAKIKREEIVEKQQLDAQYAPAAQTELADIHRVLPALGITTAAPSDDDSEAPTATPAEDQLLHLGLDEQTNAEESNTTATSSDSNDASKDDIGLDQLLNDN